MIITKSLDIKNQPQLTVSLVFFASQIANMSSEPTKNIHHSIRFSKLQQETKNLFDKIDTQLSKTKKELIESEKNVNQLGEKNASLEEKLKKKEETITKQSVELAGKDEQIKQLSKYKEIKHHFVHSALDYALAAILTEGIISQKVCDTVNKLTSAVSTPVKQPPTKKRRLNENNN